MKRTMTWGGLALFLLVSACGSDGVGLSGSDDGRGCRIDRECLDDDPCNGDEWCDDGACAPGVPPDGGRWCTLPSGAGVCRGGFCVPAGCGNGTLNPGEDCDDGNLDRTDGCDIDCRFLCRSDAECGDGIDCTVDECAAFGTGRACRSVPIADGAACDDRDPCTTADRCIGGACGGHAVDCDDGDPCTADRCNAWRPAADPCVHDRLPNWYPDFDGDGWGIDADPVCAARAPPGRARRVGDCCDSQADVFPGQSQEFETPYVCGSDGSPSFDYNCNGTWDLWWPNLAEECPSGTRTDYYGCPYEARGWCDLGGEHAECAGVPGCGERGLYQECIANCGYWSCGWKEGGDDATGDAGTPDAGAADARGDYSDSWARKESAPSTCCCVEQFDSRVQTCR